ncbi:MAG TPA: biotin/lipoyl-binding protein [Planctomycetia bacterium]|nr:biotin/lipoyl-binding protein [Planctomycetia bacterium]
MVLNPPIVDRPARLRWWMVGGALALLAMLAIWRLELPFTSNLRLAFAGSNPPSNPPPEANRIGLTDLADDALLVAGQGQVDVDGGIRQLAPKIAGEIAKIEVKESQLLKAGDPILRISSAIAQLQVEAASAAVSQAKLKLEQARRGPKALAIQRDLVNQGIAASQAKANYAARGVQRAERVGDAGLADQTTNARDLSAAAQADLKSQQLKLQQLELERPEEAVRLAEIALGAAETQLKTAQESLRQYTLEAPMAGRVLRILVGEGENFAPGFGRGPAIWFCPETPRIVRCEIEQEFASRVTKGQKAEILDDATGRPLAKGTVDFLSSWIALRRNQVEDPRGKTDVRTMECIVKIDGDAAGLRIGQNVRVLIRDAAPPPPGR